MKKVVGPLASDKVGNTKDVIMTGNSVVEHLSSIVTSSSVDDATEGTKVENKKARQEYTLHSGISIKERKTLHADRQNERNTSADAKKKNAENSRKYMEKKRKIAEDDKATMIKLKAKKMLT